MEHLYYITARAGIDQISSKVVKGWPYILVHSGIDTPDNRAALHLVHLGTLKPAFA